MLLKEIHYTMFFYPFLIEKYQPDIVEIERYPRTRVTDNLLPPFPLLFRSIRRTDKKACMRRNGRQQRFENLLVIRSEGYMYDIGTTMLFHIAM